MDKIQKAVSAVFTVKTFAYNFAKARDNQKALARDFNSRYPNFLTDTPPEIKADLDNGAYMRYSENNPNKQGYFVLKDDAWARADKSAYDAESNSNKKIHLTVALVTSMTTQAFGALKKADSKRHALYKDLRDGALAYAREMFAKIKGFIVEIQNEGKAKEPRNPASNFDVHAKDTLDNLVKRCKNAIARGDVTADNKKLADAVRAFKLAYFGAGYKAKIQE